jgi:hypothetical protein
MKKLLLILVVCLSCISSTFADNYTPEQLKFRSSLMTFLKEEGFSPYIDNSDNSLCFKKEGVLYWIIVGKDTPHFMTFNRSGWSFTGENAIDRNTALKAANDVNRVVESAKTYCSDKNVVFSVESYSRSAEDYKYVFYGNLRSLDSAYNTFKKQYQSYSGNSQSGDSGSSYNQSYSNNDNGNSGSGSMIFYDDFSSYSSMWKTDAQSKSLKFTDGYMVCKDYDNNGWTIFSRSLPESLTNSNFTIEYSAKLINRDLYSTMFFFMGSSYETSHTFGLAKMGDYSLVDGGTYENMHTYAHNIKPSSYVDGLLNKFVIKKFGNYVSFYCNNSLVFTSKMENIEINKIGFFFGHKSEMWIDYIKITQN